MTDVLAPAPSSARKASVNRATVVAGLHVVVPPIATVILIIALWGPNLISWGDVVLLAVMYPLTFLGISVGYHRYLVHRSFKTNRFVEGVLLILGSMTGQGLPIFWAAGHRAHHAFADQPPDAHSPSDGFLHSHIGWLVKPDCHPDYDRYARDLTTDPYISWINRLYPVWLLISLAVPFAIGGWSGLLWGGFVRILLAQHSSWFTNSIGHSVGSRPFDTADDSRNLWLLSVTTMGEGWHNNHHAFPWSSVIGLRWWQIDISAYVIRLLEVTGLAWDVRRVSPELLEARLARGAAGRP